MKSLLVFVLGAVLAQAAAPVIYDTDIGTDIDDAYALVQILHSPELELLGVTTVSGDTVARARLAAKLLHVAGRPEIPVHAGRPGPTQEMAQCGWARGFSSPALNEAGAVEFLRTHVGARPGQVTIIAVGELTNVAALLAADPAIAPKIKAIALMGGAFRRGYAAGSQPEPEWNIRSNVAAARIVLASGVPLLIAPLDTTADLHFTPAMRVQLFTRGTPLTNALAALNSLWRHTNSWKGVDPVFYDSFAVALVASPSLAPLTPLHVEVTEAGLTREVTGRPANAQVALTADRDAVMSYCLERLAR